MIDPRSAFSLSRIGDSLTFAWHVPQDLPYLEGHFPGLPVVPGVALIDGALEGIRSVEDNPRLVISAIKSAKFTRLVTPGVAMELRLERRTEGWRATWSEKQSDGDVVSAQIDLSLFPTG